MSEDLTAWLRAQLDDDERVARAGFTHPERWVRVPPGIPNGLSCTAVLAEVDAKRRILDGCEETLAGEDSWDPQLDGGTRDPYDLARFVLRMLALPYADRPGYRDEWRP